MSEQRLRLDGILRRVLQETVGEIHLYYQPPANLKMQYPCIRYDLNRIHEDRNGRQAEGKSRQLCQPDE